MTLQNDYQVNNGVTLVGPGGALNITGTFSQSGATSIASLSGGGLTANAVNILGGQLNMGGGSITGPVVVGTGAILSDSGVINGNLWNYGTIILGTAGIPGTLTLNGNYTQDAAGNPQVIIGGAPTGQFGQLNASGNVSLNGNLTIALANGFVPNSGRMFDFLIFGGQQNGTFAQLVLQGDAATLGWLQVFASDAVGLQVQ